MVDINSFVGPDYAVLATAGAVVLACLLAAIFALPWRCCRWQRFEAFNTYWKGKILLELILAFWAALLILRLALLWGPYSIVAPGSVTSWTGAGWLCRIYLTAALGIAAPLSSWFFLFLLAAGKSESERSTLSLATKYYTANTPSSHRSRSQYVAAYTTTTTLRDGSARSNRETPSPPPQLVDKKVRRAFLCALLCTFPITLLQTAAAWVSTWVEYQGEEIEKQPRTLIGYFLATFWYGTPAQCDVNVAATAEENDVNNTVNCTLCTFPAASAILHLLWTFIFFFSLWTVTSRIAVAALNRSLQRRLRVLVFCYTLFASLGCVFLGVSVVEGPFTWINQAFWLGYVATVAATALVLSWLMVIVPTHSSRVAAKRALEWEEGGDASGQLMYAQAVVSAPDFPPYSYPCPLQQNVQQLSTLTTTANANVDVDGFGDGTDSGGIHYEASAPPLPAPIPPYCHIELATQPPISSTTRKLSRSRIFSTKHSRASSDGGGGGDENLVITARDVLAVADNTGSGSLGGVSSSPFMTPQHPRTHRPSTLPTQQQQQLPPQLGYARSESPISQGRSSWPLPPPSPTPSVSSLQLASYYQPHWQQQQQQRGLASRPSTASSSAPPTTVSPVYQSYGSGAMSRGINYSSGGGAGLGLGLFGNGGGGGGRYHHPSSSFGRGQELETPTSSGTATPTPQSRQQQVFPPWH